MGVIKVETWGSFGEGSMKFRAEDYGHADAVAQAIRYLAQEVLPFATALDHRLHEEGEAPSRGWDRNQTGPGIPAK